MSDSGFTKSALILRLELDDDPEIVDRDTRALLRQICDTVDRDARLPEAPAQENTRAGGAMMLGEIALALLSSGAAVALLETCKAYLTRKRGATISVTRADGARFLIEADDVSDDQFEKSVSRVAAFAAQGEGG